MSERVEFILSMPSVNSWNGKWSGASRRYAIKKNLTNKIVERLELPNSWHHHFGDGWSACVSARIMEPGERFKKSDGFCGYDWMVQNIIWYGRIATCDSEHPHKWVAEKPGWERCANLGCGTSRKLPEPVEASQ